ncbi:MAG: hypothetical protein Rubg2KO_39570 [Rubricoccaceae bacterium]
MRHGKKIKKIGRSTSHRKATLQSMSAALIEHKRITTTLGKARALRMFVEPILTRSKDDSTASRRQAFRRLQNKDAVKALYGEIAEAIGDRPGGYTRVVKLGQRQGDAAEMAVIELVDFNDVKPEGAAGSRKKTRRSRRGGSGSAKKAAPAAAAPVVEDAEEAVAEEAAVELAPEAEVEETASSEEAPEADAEETPEAAVAEETNAPESQEAEAVASEAANPDATGNPQVPQTDKGADHPDAEQGAAPGTGEPPPEADAENQGRSGDAR